MTKSTLVALLVGVGLGLGAGYLLFWEGAKEPTPAPAVPAESLAPEQRKEEAPALAGRSEEPPSPEAVAEPARTGSNDAQASELPAARVSEVAARIRTEAKNRIAAANQALANAQALAEAQVTEELEATRRAEEDRARGGTMAWLRNLSRNDMEGTTLLVSSPEKFDALFARQTSGGTVRGEDLTSFEDVDDGDTIMYPAGQFDLDTQSLRRVQAFPKDVIIEGRSMDETLLVMNDELSMRGEVHSLTFRDLTLHCGDNYLEDLRREPYTLKLERCRIIGFDMGAGGSSMLCGSTGAFYAIDSKFEAGFGRSPGSGNLFDVRGALVAKLDNCEITGPFRSITGSRHRNAVVFRGCTIRRVPEHRRRYVESGHAGARFIDCEIDYTSERAPREPRSVTELNPAWKDKYTER